MPHTCIINAHPDPSPERFVAALCNAAEDGAREAGHGVSRIDIGALEFPLLSSAAEFGSPPPEPILSERDKIAAADHLILVFPLWLGSLPAKARGFFEQCGRAGFFLETAEDNKGWPKRMMKGKSARIITTMGMPGPVYSLMMDQGALKAIERGLLGLSGFKPIHHAILGGVDAASSETRTRWLAQAREHGRRAD